MKTFIASLFFILSTIFTFAQEGLKIGVSAGLPLGDASDNYIVKVQGNLDYLFHISEEIHIGVTTGYAHFIQEDSDDDLTEHFSYLPLGGTAQFHITEKMKIGADLGYGLVINPEDIDGGFYYSPKLQYALSEKTDIVLAYRGLELENASITAIAIGFEFGFPKF